MDLIGFEAAVFRRQHSDALNRLLAILRALATGKALADDAERDDARSPASVLHTRLAAAMAGLFADPQLKLNDAGFALFCVLARAIDNLFAASAFGSSDHALRLIGGSGAAPVLGDRQALMRFHVLMSIDSALPVDIADILKQPPETALILYLKHLSAKPIVSAQGQARRERLVESWAQLRPAKLPDSVDYAVQLANAWMLCSYAGHAEKHRVKATLNTVMRDWMLRRGLDDAAPAPERPLPERPTMVVAAEILHSNHVQYRYFGQWLRQMRRRFRLVLVSDVREVDNVNRGLFDEVFAFARESEGKYLADAVAFIKKTAPDLIFYPSVGMRHWGVALANLRLAPIQFTAIGHSASTFCPMIDYYLIEHGYVGDPALFSETVVLLDDRKLRFERSPHYRPVPPQLRAQAQPLRIALAANLLKLNPHFLDICRRIADRSPRPLEFHAFPNNAGLELDVARLAIRRALPGARVYPVLAYNEYLQRLNECDLSFSPYPFGGLHSVVDSLRQGIPVIAVEGKEPHARTDAMLIRLLGLPEWLICQNEDAYVETALRVIGDDALRLELGRQALALDIDRRLFGDGSTALGSEIDDAVWWLWRHHEAVKADGRKAWTPDARGSFGG